jgi:glycosyltransferase involved in cell wall biosynthesis
MNNQLLSVIVAIKNEEKHIGNCLESIKKQTYPQELIEIIVVDNNSEDKTKEISESFSRGLAPLNLKVFNRGPERSAQRNFGVEKSSGQYVMYLDADMILSKNVIKDCVEYADKNKDTVGLYVSEIVMGKKYWSKVRRFERSFYDATVIDCVRFIKKDIFQKVGGFDETFTGPEDWDLDKKIRNAGKVALIETPIYHNESEFDLIKYLGKKAYYAKQFNEYISKWGRGDEDLKKQFGFCYRYFGVFFEKGKWKKLVTHPVLAVGMYFLRFMVGIKYLTR